MSGGGSDAGVIYDFGANDGGDIPYYLEKAETVVAVEANPTLCTLVAERFAAAIETGRLHVVNSVLVEDALDGSSVDFHLHRTNHVMSQYPPPPEALAADYERVRLPARSVASIVAEFGAPLYVKIDIEHYDEVVLRALFAAGIRPPYLSAEAHDVEVFALLVAVGGYDAFQLVDGSTVSERFAEHVVAGRDGPVPYAFPPHSAGPFGEDIGGQWLSANDFLPTLATVGLGWRDIHATSVHAPVASEAIDRRALSRLALANALRGYVPAPLRRVLKALVARR